MNTLITKTAIVRRTIAVFYVYEPSKNITNFNAAGLQLLE